MASFRDPFDLAGLALPNRVVMAPLTRCRAHGPNRTPTPMMATYYAQRAGAGLIIAEATHPSPIGQGFPDEPGLHSTEQVEGWRKVTDAVHAEGGRIFVQLMHAGRVAPPDLIGEGRRPVGPSPVAAAGRLNFDGTPIPEVVPEELTADGIASTVEDFVTASRNAMDAGFDGVELHAANGYLLHQFLSDRSNRRTDQWGGSVNNRIRLILDLAEAVGDAIGLHRVGLRISPGATANALSEDAYADTYLALAWELPSSGMAYLHVAESPGDRELTSRLRRIWDGPLILNPATPQRWTGPQDLHLIEDGTADLLSFGTLFISNPDLPARLAVGGPYTDPDPATFMSGGEQGYLDYPPMDGDRPLLV